MEELKAQYFHSHPDDPVVFHRKEMLNAKPPFECLVVSETRSLFDAQLLELLARWEFTVISVCIDKRAHKERYTTWRYDPYHYCLEVLFERFVFFLNRRTAEGDVMAESRGGKEDTRLKASFARLWESGTHYVDKDQIQKAITSKQLKVKQKSNNVCGLQVADLIAHPSRNEILTEQGMLTGKLGPFAEKVIQILQRKYDRSGKRVFGKKFL